MAPQLAERLARSAEKRNPDRFDKYLSDPNPPAPVIPSLGPDARHTSEAVASAVTLPTSEVSGHFRDHTLLRKSLADAAVFEVDRDVSARDPLRGDRRG